MAAIDSFIPALLTTISGWVSSFNSLLSEGSLMLYAVNVLTVLAALGLVVACIIRFLSDGRVSSYRMPSYGGWGVPYRGARRAMGGVVHGDLRERNKQLNRIGFRALGSAIREKGLRDGIVSWGRERVQVSRGNKRNEEITGIDRKTQDKLDTSLGKAVTEENLEKAAAVDAETNAVLDRAIKGE